MIPFFFFGVSSQAGEIYGATAVPPFALFGISESAETAVVEVDEATPGIAAPRKRRRKPVAQQTQDKPDPWRDVPEVNWSMVAQRVEASLQADRKARMRANAQKLMLLMAA